MGGTHFIGEIKVTHSLRVADAFRTALGQLLEYRHLKCAPSTALVMFLDQPLDSKRLELATQFGIAVVVARDGQYTILNTDASPLLSEVFAG